MRYITNLKITYTNKCNNKCYKVTVFHRILLGKLIPEFSVVNVQIITVVHIINAIVFAIVSNFVQFCNSPELKFYVLVNVSRI